MSVNPFILHFERDLQVLEDFLIAAKLSSTTHPQLVDMIVETKLQDSAQGGLPRTLSDHPEQVAVALEKKLHELVKRLCPVKDVTLQWSASISEQANETSENRDKGLSTLLHEIHSRLSPGSQALASWGIDNTFW